MRRWIARVVVAVAASLLAASAAEAAHRLKGEPRIAMLHLSTVDDGGWSQALEQARVKTEEALGIDIAYTENVPEDHATILRLVDRYVREGYNIIVGTSWGYGDAFLDAARKYPDVAFLNCAGTTAAPNLESFYARTYQGWYLAGIVAGHLTRSGTIGVLGGFPLSSVAWDLNAFLRGARSVDPAIDMIPAFLHSWYDPARETRAAKDLLARGVDVLGSTLNATGPHLAFQAQAKRSIGVQIDMSDRAPDAVATPVVYRWEAYLIPTLSSIVAGTWTPRTPQWWKGIETGVVDLAPIAAWVPAEAVADVEAARAVMIAGELDPFQGPLYRQDGTLAVPAGDVLSDEGLRRMTYFVRGVADPVATE